MRATVMFGAGDVRIETVPDARLIEPTDALVVVSRACICGSDLEADDDVNDEIDAAYRTKYRRYGARYVDPMVSREPRAATIKRVPRSTSRPTTSARR